MFSQKVPGIELGRQLKKLHISAPTTSPSCHSVFIRQGVSNSTFKCKKTWCLFKNGIRGDGENPVAMGGGPFCGSRYLHPFSCIISSSAPATAPAPAPMCPLAWLFPRMAWSLSPFLAPAVVAGVWQACHRHVAGVF